MTPLSALGSLAGYVKNHRKGGKVRMDKKTKDALHALSHLSGKSKRKCHCGGKCKPCRKALVR